MKLTDKQKEKYQRACRSTICRLLIPNVIKIGVDLNDLERPELSVFTRPVTGPDEYCFKISMTDRKSILKYFKKVEFMYGIGTVGLSLETSVHFKNHIDRTIQYVMNNSIVDDRRFIYIFGAIPDYKELTIDNTNWHSLENTDDLRFTPMDLDRVLDKEE